MLAKLKAHGNVEGMIKEYGMNRLFDEIRYVVHYNYRFLKWTCLDVEPQKVHEIHERIMAYLPDARVRREEEERE